MKFEKKTNKRINKGVWCVFEGSESHIQVILVSDESIQELPAAPAAAAAAAAPGSFGSLQA